MGSDVREDWLSVLGDLLWGDRLKARIFQIDVNGSDVHVYFDSSGFWICADEFCEAMGFHEISILVDGLQSNETILMNSNADHPSGIYMNNWGLDSLLTNALLLGCDNGDTDGQ